MGIKCPKCHYENPDDTLYCGKCAASLESPKDIHVAATKTLETTVKHLTTGSIFAGRYQVIEELGKGGMGTVYKVLDREIKENVALKLLNPEIASDGQVIERFRNELKFARKITHKNVCRMYDLNKHENTPYITMEYVSGEDLKSTLRRVGHLSTAKAVYVAKQVCDGLAEAHKLGVVHRDLKPQNIIIDDKGHARIMDFGIARSLKAKGVTTTGMIIGTPDYISPEQVEGIEVDPRADIYSMGVILYEMLTGDVPFEGKTPMSIALKHKTEIPREPKEFNPQIPDGLNQLVMKCLEKKREKRYQNTTEIHKELTKIEKNIPTKEMILERKTNFLMIFLRKLKERKIIHTLAAFIGGGAALIEFAHHILVGHYHLPKIVVDYIIAALIIAMLSTVSWQWFLGEEALRQQARRIWKKRFKRIATLVIVAFLIFVAAWQFTSLPEILGIAPKGQELEGVSDKVKDMEARIQAPSAKGKKSAEVVAAEKQEPKKPKPAPVEKAPPKLEKVVSKPSEVDKEKPEVSRILDQGITAFNEGDFDECIRKMKEVINLDPANTSAQYFLSEAKKRQSEKTKEQKINDILKMARDAFRKGDYQEGTEQVKKVLGSDPQNVEARKLMMQTRLRMADQQAKALVNSYIQSLNSNNLLDFYRKACVPQLFQRLRKRTESSMSMFESFQSTASDIKTQFKGINQAEISFFNNITGISKKGLKHEIFNGYVKWRIRRTGDNWRIVNITTTPEKKK